LRSDHHDFWYDIMSHNHIDDSLRSLVTGGVIQYLLINELVHAILGGYSTQVHHSLVRTGEIFSKIEILIKNLNFD